jgi:hypothetical protein
MSGWFKSFKEAIGIKKKFNVHDYLEKNPKLKAKIDEDNKKREKAVDALMNSVQADLDKDKEKKKKDEDEDRKLEERLAKLMERGGNKSIKKSIKRKNIRRNKSIKRKKTRSKTRSIKY